MPETKEPSCWVFRCQKCGHEVFARSFLYQSPCPVCNGRLKNLGREGPFPEREGVKADEARAKKD